MLTNGKKAFVCFKFLKKKRKKFRLAFILKFFDTIEFPGFLLKFHEKCEQIKKYLDQLKKK